VASFSREELDFTESLPIIVKSIKVDPNPVEFGLWIDKNEIHFTNLREKETAYFVTCGLDVLGLKKNNNLLKAQGKIGNAFNQKDHILLKCAEGDPPTEPLLDHDTFPNYPPLPLSFPYNCLPDAGNETSASGQEPRKVLLHMGCVCGHEFCFRKRVTIRDPQTGVLDHRPGVKLPSKFIGVQIKRPGGHNNYLKIIINSKNVHAELENPSGEVVSKDECIEYFYINYLLEVEGLEEGDFFVLDSCQVKGENSKFNVRLRNREDNGYDLMCADLNIAVGSQAKMYQMIRFPQEHQGSLKRYKIYDIDKTGYSDHIFHHSEVPKMEYSC